MASNAAPARGLVHTRTLLGAIDDHEGFLLHNRPWLADERTEALERLAGAWLTEGGDNWVPTLAASPEWVGDYLDSLDEPERGPLCQALAEFFLWARGQGIVAGR